MKEYAYPPGSKLSRERVLKYARKAVRAEFINPQHGHFAGYDNDAACDDVLNHFPELTVDDDEDLIRDVVREAERLEYPDREL